MKDKNKDIKENKELEKENKKLKKERKKIKNKDSKGTDEKSIEVVKKEKGKFFKKIKRFFVKTGEVLRKKWLVNTSKTILLVAIIILLYVGVNIILQNVILPEIDVTSDKLYSLSDESKDKLQDIDEEVLITIINYSSDSTIVNFVEKYVAFNNNITMEQIDDLSSRTDLMTTYSLESTDSVLLVSSGDKEEIILDSDLYTIDYTTYEYIDITEEAITNTILDVTTEDKPKIYFMSNHLAYDVNYFSTIMDSMEAEANEVDTVDLFATGKVPDDTDLFIITTLGEDITEQEKDSLISYINQGGNLLLMCGPNITGIDLSNFQEVLDQYGVSISDGVVFEGESSNMISGYPDFIVETAESYTSITQNLNMSMNLCFIDAGNITFDEDNLESLGVEYEVLAETSESSYIRTDITQTSASRTSSDSEEQVCTVAALATKEIDEETESKIIIFSNELFAMDMPIQINTYTMYTVSLYNNEDMLLNSASYLNEREDTITIRKTSEEVTYTVTEEQNRIIMTIIFTVPILIIMLGIGVWQARRRKK